MDKFRGYALSSRKFCDRLVSLKEHSFKIFEPLGFYLSQRKKHKDVNKIM